MSESKNFPPEEVSVDQLLAALSKQLDRHSIEIHHLKSIADSFHYLFEEVKNVNQLVEQPNKYIRDLSKSLEEKMKGIVKDLEGQKMEILSIEDAYKSMKQSLESVEAGTSQGIQRMESRLKESESTFVSRSDFEAYQSSLLSQNEAFNRSLSDLRKNLDFLSAKIEKMAHILDVHFSLHQDHLKNDEEMAVQMQKHAQSNAANLSIYLDSIHVKLNAMEEQMARDLETFKRDVLNSPSSLESVKNELLKKFDVVSLDASNALIKSTNSDNQIRILERKLENIMLLLKSHELTK